MKSKPLLNEDRTVTVDSLGGRGDGVACDAQGHRFYVPFTLPGETASVRPGPKRGDGHAAGLLDVTKASPDRVEAPCRHFGTCGGCALQHCSDSGLARFKRGIVQDAFAKRGLDPDLVGETVATPPFSRRRARLGARRLKGRTVLGFNERFGKMVLDIAECHILTPQIMALLAPLRKVLAPLSAFGKGGDVQITQGDTGLEVVLIPDRRADLTLKQREDLLAFAEAQDLARLSWENDGFLEPLAGRRPVRVQFGKTLVDLPAGSFLQPSKVGEKILADLVVQGVAGAKKVADLYCGCGSLTFPIATQEAPPVVHAADGLDTQIDALRKAAAGLRVTADVRDLARKPLTEKELNRFDAVVFDPPRAGAQPQAEALAKSSVQRVVAVSCNPATLARDLRVLVDGGYRIETVTPVDQFTWSAHVEAVATLCRD